MLLNGRLTLAYHIHTYILRNGGNYLVYVCACAIKHDCWRESGVMEEELIQEFQLFHIQLESGSSLLERCECY